MRALRACTRALRLRSTTRCFSARTRFAGRDGRKVMVVVTDGGDTMSQEDYQTALRAAQQAETMVYSIIIVPIESSAGRDIGGEHALIQISNDTGGKYFYASGIAATR